MDNSPPRPGAAAGRNSYNPLQAARAVACSKLRAVCPHPGPPRLWTSAALCTAAESAAAPGCGEIPGQKTTRRRQAAPRLGRGEGSRACPQAHPPWRCITAAGLDKNRTTACRPRRARPAALCPRLVHRPVHGKRGQPPAHAVMQLSPTVHNLVGRPAVDNPRQAAGGAAPRLLSKASRP